MIPVLVNISEQFIEFSPSITEMMQCFRVKPTWIDGSFHLKIDSQGVLLEHAPKAYWSQLPLPTELLGLFKSGICFAYMDDYNITIQVQPALRRTQNQPMLIPSHTRVTPLEGLGSVI
jgi:hypothetical protein